MPRYIPKPKLDWTDEDAPLIPSLNVDVIPPQKTGLLDEDGNHLFKLPDQIGFVRDD